MTDAFEAIIWTFCLQMMFDKRLRNEFHTQINHFSKIWAFKVNLKIAFSNFDPSQSNRPVDFNFPSFIVIFIFRALNTFSHLDIKYT